jgi:sigma-B regulation protein RsbU (phosphoserine phosphatase)
MSRMVGEKEPSSFSKRLAKLASRFEVRSEETPEGSRLKFHRVFLNDLHALFTRDITREGLRDLVKRDAREAARFYAQTIDLKSLQSMRWYRRYPQAAWKIFIALAHRLSPPRRLAFAIAILAAALGWTEFILFRTSLEADSRSSGALWLALSFAVVLMLLFMELRDKLDLKGDLEIAREIQFGLVPSEPFFESGIGICHLMRPANTVGGDYYDIIRLDDNRIGIVMGDVSGKGMPAALLMALLLGSLRTLTTAGLRGTGLMTQLNDYLSANIPEERLVTLFYGELEMSSGRLTYINAGHNPPFLMRRGQTMERLASTSIVLGIRTGSVYESAEANLEPGDGLLLFTDGITEAFNDKDEEYGESRLAAFLSGHMGLEPQALLQVVTEDVVAFCGSARPADDMTLMLVTRQPGV